MTLSLLPALAVIPAIMLVFYIYKKDAVEKEPIPLLLLIFFLGAVTFLIDAFIEPFGKMLIGRAFGQGTVVSIFLYKFFVVALLEEFFKLAVVMLVAWKHKAFNYTFDAVVYAVTSSLGFAAIENFFVVAGNGPVVALTRSIITIGGHAAFAVFMGLYLGKAKKAAASGDKKATKVNLFMAWLIPMVLHGFFDFSLDLSSLIMLLVFFVYEIALLVLAVREIGKLSRNDMQISDNK